MIGTRIQNPSVSFLPIRTETIAGQIKIWRDRAAKKNAARNVKRGREGGRKEELAARSSLRLRALREGRKGRQRNSLLSDRTSSLASCEKTGCGRRWPSRACLLHGPLSDRKETKESFSFFFLPPLSSPPLKRAL